MQGFHFNGVRRMHISSNNFDLLRSIGNEFHHFDENKDVKYKGFFIQKLLE